MVLSSLLYAETIEITSYLSIRIPTVGEIIDNEDLFNDIVCSVVSTPYELMVPLDDAGINFTEISRFDLFCILFNRLRERDTSILFSGVDFSKYRHAEDEGTGEVVLIDEEGHKIDRIVHDKLARALRQLLQLSVNDKKPGNEEARKYMLERARAKYKSQMRRAKQTRKSQLESYIVAMVNACEFKYDYRSVRDLTIYQFYSSLKQISHRIQYDNIMFGYYSGSIKFDDIAQENKSWILTTDS
jgi:hypothetical protein